MVEEYAYCMECGGQDERKKVVRKIYGRNGLYNYMRLALECGHEVYIMSRPLQLQAYCQVCDHTDLGEGYLRTITEFCIHPQSNRIEVAMECGHKLTINLPSDTKLTQQVQVTKDVEVPRKEPEHLSA
jgi:hypothetical protein